jgi:DNA-binding response OmpR family regulator
MTRRVLIVDDEGNIRRMMRLTLEADGYEVEDAADGTAALERFGDGSRFDAVVLDQKMPGMDGIETLRQMLRRSPRATIIMVTAFGSIDLAVDAMKAGARDFLRKPLTPALLRDAVRAALSKGSDSPGHDGTPQAAELPAERREPAPPGAHEVWTVNGFFIRTLPSSADLAPALEHRFAVRHVGGGPYGEVLVTISSAEARRIATLSGRALPGPAFWRDQAERALMNHMFNAAALPPGNHLLINQLPDEVVLLARNWRD